MLSSVIDKAGRTQRVLQLRTSGLLILLLGIASIGSVSAQDVQVPFDRDSTLYTVEPDLRDRLGLFSDVTGFQQAELYRVDDSTYELVVRYTDNGRSRRNRRTLSAAEVEALREDIAERSTASGERAFTQDGRYSLIAATTILGLAEGGLLSGAFGADDEQAVALPLLGGTAGFFIPLLATRDARVTDAEASITFYGGLQGYAHAVELSWVLGDGEIGGRATSGIAAVTGAVESTVAYRIARHNNWSSGHSKMVAFTGLGGNFIGGGIGTIITGTDESSRVEAGTALLGSLGGIYLGHRMGRTERYTTGDARVYLQSAILAASLMGSILGPQDDLSSRTAASLVTGSAIGGSILGRRLVRNRDFTGNQGALTALGSTAGALSGWAFAVLADSDDTSIPASVGAAAGFGLTYAVLEGDAKRQASSNASAFNLDLHVSPSMAGGPGEVTEVAPQVSLRATF